jgi:glycosyltransferase involved in cell wall biosynthesis
VLLCLEQTLGHRTHGLNLTRALEASDLQVQSAPVDFPERRRLPMPWALRGSLAAYRSARSAAAFDVAFFHTQTVSLFAPLAARGRRYVVSVDATPPQIDAMARWYEHARQPGLLERAKRAWYRRVLDGASAIVSWSSWAADSLATEYGVDRSRVTVIHPGAPREYFALPRSGRSDRPKLLFVGGDFERKGGPALLKAFANLEGDAELLLVTPAEVPSTPGVRVVRADPGSAELLAAYAEADVFCLPTRADCTPVVLSEAMAAGLPVVTTSVGSNTEWVPEQAGVIVPPNDPRALRSALDRLLGDAELRARLAQGAREHASLHMDAERNASRLLDVLVAQVER